MEVKTGEHLEIGVRESCWSLTLNRPDQLNALNGTLVEDLIAALEAAACGGARVVLLQGRGKNFSAGFDLSDLEQYSDGDLLWRFVRIQLLLETIEQAPFLTVAYAHGANFGAGVDLFAACRWRFAAPGATFRMPGLLFELVLGTERFASIVGAEAARDILEAARSFDAQEAKDMGFVREIIAPAEVQAEAARAEGVAAILPPRAALLLGQALREPRHDALSKLVRSAAQPGLKIRIREYLAAQQRARAAANRG